MQLNDRTDFGLRLLLTLTGSAPRRWSARELAELHNLSFTHVQKVVQQLDAAGFVDTVRGRGGGVTLAPGTSERSIGDVVRALEPHMHLVRCLREGESGCVLQGECALTGVIVSARAAFLRELDAATLADVAARTPAVLL